MLVCVERSRFSPRAFSVTAQEEMSKGLTNKQLQKIELLLCVSPCCLWAWEPMYLLLLSSLYFYEYAYWQKPFHLLPFSWFYHILSCASLLSFRERWSFTLHMDIKQRTSWWIANKYNLYGQSMPEVLFTPFSSANGMAPAHFVGLVPKNWRRKWSC